MFEAVEHIVYINLDERGDRKLNVQRELLRVFPVGKVRRFAAIKEEIGGIGCTKSHIAVLEMAKAEGWGNVMIVEDDFVWKNFEAGAPVLTELLTKPYDVIVIGGTYVMCDSTYRLASCQTTTGYIVQRGYYDTLLANYKEGLDLLQKTNAYNVYALDQYWKRLHKTGNWRVVQPTLCAQKPGYSDIEKRVVNYSQYFR
jgi:glycosyl transferase family 25